MLWKKSVILITHLFLGRWRVVERKHLNPEASVTAHGTGTHGGPGARRSAVLVRGVQRSLGQDPRAQEVRGAEGSRAESRK